MKTLNFSYTKKDGAVSDRVVVLASSPTEFYSGTDISELDLVEQGQYIYDRKVLLEEYTRKINELNEKYDLNYRFRKFDPKQMQNVVTEII